MAHTFLVESGRWILQGNWLDKNQNQIPVRGGTIIKWDDPNWFTMMTKLVFPKSNIPETKFEYKGHLPTQQLQYTYVLDHSRLGKIEGEGWINPESIVQRYWVIGDPTRRNGFESLFYVDEDTYHLSSGIMKGNYLESTMEAILERS
jgi:hypothetical protein